MTPPVTAPPVTAPPVTAPPVTGPPVPAPPVTDETFRLRLQGYSLRTLIFAFLLYLGAVAFGYLGMPHNIGDQLQHDFRDFLRDMAIALAVGVYLMVTVEHLNALKVESSVQNYIRTVAESVMKAIYGKRLPDDLFQVIRSTIFDQSFVRDRYDIEVHIHDIEQYAELAPASIKPYLVKFITDFGKDRARDYRLVYFEIYYETRNVATKSEFCKVGWESPQPFGNKYEGLSGLVSVKINGKPQFDGLYLKNADSTADKSHLLYEQLAPAAPDQQLDVKLESYSIRKSDDKEAFQVMTACRELTIAAFDHDTKTDILLWLDAPPAEGAQIAAHKEPRTNTAKLRVDQYLLPYQGVTVHWRPKTT